MSLNDIAYASQNWSPKVENYQHHLQQHAQLMQFVQRQQQEKKVSGDKPVVICNGQAHDTKNLEDAQAVAERLAHHHQTDAFILKPVRKVSPKRDVVTVDL